MLKIRCIALIKFQSNSSPQRVCINNNLKTVLILSGKYATPNLTKIFILYALINLLVFNWILNIVLKYTDNYNEVEFIPFKLQLWKSPIFILNYKLNWAQLLFSLPWMQWEMGFMKCTLLPWFLLAVLSEEEPLRWWVVEGATEGQRNDKTR